ncbi:hypothetical protein ARAM_006078 [Aspergillus rambellii]|uniref:UDP-galactose transporter n=1 Tax=Aspergillus rambellii TaxID=308745 RepID=A0A0F8V7U2_9EURO|nr:hypothetical protein ARAM_006078 [Aspergillus rambellii]
MASVTLQHKVQSRPAETKERFEPLTGIILVEILKFILSAIYVLYSLSLYPKAETPSPTFFTAHKDAAVPALLYTIATILQSVGAYYLDLVPYLVLSQLKVIMAPLFARTILNQRYPLKNWLYVAMMALGIVLAQLGSTAGNSSATKPLEARAIVHGVASMLLAGVCVALGSIYMEKTIKRSGFLFLCNAQLAGYSFVFALLYFGWLTQFDFAHFFSGFTVPVVIYIGLQVSGGFLVACLPLVLSQHRINIQLLLGVVLVLTSVLASAFSAQKKATTVNIQDEYKSPEMAHV